jgi:hypothetical protein
MRLAVLTVLVGCLFQLPIFSQSDKTKDPETTLWLNIKHALTDPDGQDYFKTSLKDCLVPTLHGTLVSSSPADHPNILLLAMPGSETADVTLKLAGRMTNPLQPGTLIRFDGIAESFVKQPFMLTFELQGAPRVTAPKDK